MFCIYEPSKLIISLQTHQQIKLIMNTKKDQLKKVLIALDYDPTAQKVAEQGYSLANAIGAHIILLHVVTNSMYYTSVNYSPIMGYGGFMDIDKFQPTLENLKTASLHFLEKAKHHLGDETIQTTVADGDIPDSILKTAKELHVDLIVLGSHSRKWLDNIVMGSVAKDVLNHTQVPLYIIPTKKHN
jgi:nucleotide-binding universal stress UspA family protein